MKTRRIGKSELTVFPIGLGTMGMSEFYGETDEKQSIRTLHAALDNGLNFIDTADAYGIGDNEELLNKALHGRWDKVTLATKFGIVRPKGQPNGERRFDGSPAYVKQACEASLKRLGREVIDLYYLHRVDQFTPIEDTVRAMAELVKEGKVRYIGLSEVSGGTLARANAVHPITAVQSEYSLWSRDIETTSLPVCRKLGISLVAYSPLGRGFLSGKITKIEDLAPDDYRRASPRFMGENFKKNLELLKTIEEIAKDKGAKASQIALAWLLGQGEEIIPIPGTKRLSYLLENIAAAEITLNAEELVRLSESFNQTAGTRYDEAGLKFTNS